MATPDHLVLETLTGPGVLGEVHCALDRAWVQHGDVPASIRISVATAVAEIGANIVQYADGGRPVNLRMEIDVAPHRVTVVFTDDGKPAAVDLNSLSFPDCGAQHGRGLALASAVLDGLSYRRDESRNHWTLVSRRFD